MKRGTAEYLLRVDDLCPTVAAASWKRVRTLIAESGLEPILAVVPENHDHALMQSPADASFWSTLRTMEAAGATIGLHGYRHRCASEDRGMLGWHRWTEFAGVPEAKQRRWIEAGLGILRGHGLSPRVWVAPRHGFDEATLRALRTHGITIVSDGFTRIPFVREGMTWIPQQLWGPVAKPAGLWTICIHPSTITEAEMVRLRQFVERHAGQFTSVDRVLAEWAPGGLGLAERLRARVLLKRRQKAFAREWRRA